MPCDHVTTFGRGHLLLSFQHGFFFPSGFLLWHLSYTKTAQQPTQNLLFFCFHVFISNFSYREHFSTVLFRTWLQCRICWSLRFTAANEIFSLQIRPVLPVRWFLSSNLNEIQSALYIHAHASCSRGQSVQQTDFAVHWTPLKKAAENKSPTIYNGCTPESNQSVGSLPTPPLHPPIPPSPSSAPYHLIAKPCWIQTCPRTSPPWLCGKQFQIHAPILMVWLGFKFGSEFV